MAGGVKGKQNKKYNVALDMVSLLAQPQLPNSPPFSPISSFSLCCRAQLDFNFL